MIPTPDEVAKLRNSSNKNAQKKVQDYVKIVEPILTKAFEGAATVGKIGKSRGTVVISESELDYVSKARTERDYIHQAISQAISTAGWKLVSSFYPEHKASFITLEVVNPKAAK